MKKEDLRAESIATHDFYADETRDYSKFFFRKINEN